MAEIILKRKIKRFFLTGEIEELDDDLINEYRIMIRIDGNNFIEAVISPSNIEEYIHGFMLTRGLISTIGDISSIEIHPGIVSVIRGNKLKEELPINTLLESTGTRNIDLDLNAVHTEGIQKSGLKVKVKDLIQGIRALKKMPIYKMTGGVHCSILFDASGKVVFSAEDIGRHNSVDKVIGGGMKSKVDFSNCWLAVSGRLPKDMIFKTVVAGIPLIASVSAVTDDGVSIGDKAGVTVIGFGREGRINCYSHPQRII